MIKKFRLVPGWWAGVQFESLGDALWWQKILEDRGFMIDKLIGDDDGTHSVMWYIDDDSRSQRGARRAH